MSKQMRPQLTPMVMFYALFDVAGMLVFASGVMWLAKGTPLFLGTFPSTMLEGILCSIAGLAVMLWAAASILRELMKQPSNKPPGDN